MLKIKSFQPEICFECQSQIQTDRKVVIGKDHIFCSLFCYWVWKLNARSKKLEDKIRKLNEPKVRKKQISLKAIYKEIYGTGYDKYNPNLE